MSGSAVRENNSRRSLFNLNVFRTNRSCINRQSFTPEFSALAQEAGVFMLCFYGARREKKKRVNLDSLMGKRGSSVRKRRRLARLTAWCKRSRLIHPEPKTFSDRRRPPRFTVLSVHPHRPTHTSLKMLPLHKYWIGPDHFARSKSEIGASRSHAWRVGVWEAWQ